MNKRLIDSIHILQKLKKNEKGSFTIEASLVFPIIFILTLILIFFSMFIYQKVVLYSIATEAVERAAFNWTNSHKIVSTGDFKEGEEDGLYWRITDDRILDLLFRSVDKNNIIEIPIGIPTRFENPSLPEVKLINIANTIPDGIYGNIYYENKIIERKIRIELFEPLQMPSFVTAIIGDKVSVEASETITDPVEFIRNIDLVRKYGEVLKDKKDKVSSILNSSKSKESK